MTFTPTPFATPIVSPTVTSGYRTASYISVSGYRFAPTAVATNVLVPKSTSEQGDSNASLAQVIARASAWMDDHCFHQNGSFAGSVVTEQMVVTQKPSGALVLICNQKPQAVVGLALGPTFSQLSDIGQNAADNIVLGPWTITVPGGFCSGYPTPWFGGWPSVNGQVIAVYSYVTGYPHATLAAPVAAGDTTITVNPPVAGATQFYAAYAGTPLTIKDNALTETVILTETPTSLVLSVTPTANAHQVPTAPDSVYVSALPSSVEQACIFTTNMLIKARGMRAQVPPSTGNASPAQRQAMGRAGILDDYDAACGFLRIYKTTFVHS